MATQPADRFLHVGKLRSILDEEGWWHSFELPDGRVIRGANSLASLRERIGHFPIPADLRGKRVLDIGSWDGWFAFEMERRGADVMAIDVFDNPRFREIHRIYESRIDYRQLDVYDLDPAKVGQFDIVLFMGVLYHLKHPLLGLERVCAVTRDTAFVDSFVLQEKYAAGVALDRPLMEFFETDEFGGQTDNWVAPNVPCLLAFCRTAGFARAHLENVGEYGASVTCRRQWDANLGPAGAALGPAPELTYAAHHIHFGINFDSAKDDNVLCWFRSDAPALRIEDVRPTVGSFGAAPLRVRPRSPGEWEVTFRLPPGLRPGWHEVRLALTGSAPSNPKRLAIDLSLESPGELAIDRAEDGTTWERGVLRREKGEVLSIWIAGLPSNADISNVRAHAAGERLTVEYLEENRGADLRQCNLQVPSQLEPGTHVLTIEIAGAAATSEFEIR